MSVMALCKINLFKYKIFYDLTGAVRRYGSTLILTGDRATQTCPVVTPYIDIEEQMKNIDTLRTNMENRGCSLDIDGLFKVWKFFSTVESTKKTLEERRQVIVDTITELKLNEKDNPIEFEKFRVHNKIIREDINHIKHALFPIEERLKVSILSLPNVVHPKTPTADKTHIETFNTKSNETSEENHIEIGVKADILQFSGPHNYYLKNDAALFELSAKFYFSDCLRKLGYVQFSNPDFTKSAVVEGCGLNHEDPACVFILHHDEDTKVNEMRLHLTGGGSLLAFAAYHTRHIVLPSLFPLRYFSLGRQYKPVPEDSKLGLFEVSQSAVVELFSAVRNCDAELNAEIDKMLAEMTAIYKNIGYHFKTSFRSLKEISPWESLRISFEMYSPHLNEYVEVGHISVSDDYISKRLRFCYKKDGDTYYPKIVSGTILNVPKLLGCVIENERQNILHFPDVFKNMF
ncbi:seryl-tRNA synthetase-like insect mitochondrial protein [Arctopsyche grandis]|uniref:seryl-tRNA synthetase-like insect mitochondrial protein n=1 Tax=Arctopsyche grandis TaxID=121162 RepID=UPI00406D9A13